MDSDSPLRIAYLSPEFVTEPKFDGGLANYLNRVTAYLHSMGHEPEVFVLSDRDETLDHNGVRVHRVRHVLGPRMQLVRRALKRATRIESIATMSMRAGAQQLVRGLLRQQRIRPYDIVQGSDYGATGLCIPRRRDFPFVTRLSYYRPLWREAHGLSASFDHLAAELLECRSMQRSDACFGPSRRIAEVVQQITRIPVEVIRPPISLDDSLKEDDTVFRTEIGDREYVLFFGRVCRIKGVDLLATAMKPLLEERPSLHLVIVGREDPDGIVDAMRRTLGPTSDRLIHIGRLPHAQLFPIIRHTRVVALPSRIDNFPNVCIEAMRLGQVVMGTREASFDELIDDGSSGFLASTESISSMTDALGRALSLTPQDRLAMGTAARHKLREFDPGITIPALCSFYRKVITSRDPSRSLVTAM